jgi:acyl-CoA thioester hydrolase
VTVAAPFVHRLRVRYHECDAQGVVFNANHFAYFDVTITELFRAAFGSYQALIDAGSDIMVVDAAASFRGPVRFEDEIEVHATIQRLGTSAMTTAFEERRGAEVPVTGRLVHVFVDPATHAKQAIPGDVRARLAPWTVPADAAVSG